MQNAVLITNLLLGLVDRAAKYRALLLQARAENRDVSAEELEQLLAEDDIARKDLGDAIRDARAG